MSATKKSSLWIDALKAYSSGKKYTIPKKDTDQYREVRALMEKMRVGEPVREAIVAPVVKKPRKKAVTKKAVEIVEPVVDGLSLQGQS